MWTFRCPSLSSCSINHLIFGVDLEEARNKFGRKTSLGGRSVCSVLVGRAARSLGWGDSRGVKEVREADVLCNIEVRCISIGIRPSGQIQYRVCGYSSVTIEVRKTNRLHERWLGRLSAAYDGRFNGRQHTFGSWHVVELTLRTTREGDYDHSVNISRTRVCCKDIFSRCCLFRNRGDPVCIF
jgi:hypothetical protein